MASPPARLDDRGMFKPNGMFEYVDERPNSLPLADTVDKQLRFQEARRLTADELLEEIRLARNRPRFQRFRRLQELAREANQKKEEERLKTDVLNMSLRDFTWRTSDRMNQILDDVANFDKRESSLFEIMTKDDRLIYMGTLVVILAFLILLIQYLE